jgi:thiol:disulfide interchange protein/DsbC/DsbD-like thiol-disulfide interchange protein
MTFLLAFARLISMARLIGFLFSLLLSQLFFLATAASLEVPPSAYAEDAFDQGEPRVKNYLVTDAQTVRPGDTFKAGVVFRMSRDWHVYWRDSGQGGMETEASFSSDVAEPGEVQWPAPTVYLEAGGEIITYGYGDEVMLFVEARVPDDASGPIEVRANVDYLVCKIDCIPGKASLSRTIDVGAESSRAPDDILARFDEATRRLPVQVDERGFQVGVALDPTPVPPDASFEILIETITCHDETDDDCVLLKSPPSHPARALAFAGIDSVSMSVNEVRPHPDARSGWITTVTGRTNPDRPRGDGLIDGVLLLTTADGRQLPTAFSAPFPRTSSAPESQTASNPNVTAPAPSPIAPKPPQVALWQALLLAFLGGMLLNLMPCVFPVLAIKVFAFVNVVHEDRRHLLLHSAAYTAGIVLSLLALASVVIGLKLVGTQVGWGFQFQEPLFIALVAAVLVVFAANLFGAFHIGVSAGSLGKVTMAKPGPRRSFGEGVLATILATPCSAPFLGTAVGFALASSTPVILLVFATLGLGLAAPFVVLTMVPGLTRLLPRPGAWMEVFKQFLGFALLGTTAWLVWLIGQMTGVNGVFQLLIFLLVCTLAVWMYGLVQYKTRALKTGITAFAVALTLATGLLTLRFSNAPAPTASPSDSANSPDHIAWLAWSEDAVQAELARGRPVFIDFTATWCITCQVNKATVIETTEVIEAVHRLNAAMFVADWTRRDDTIRAKLAEFGKAGVPLYLVYSPESPSSPRVLPEVITRAMVIEALEQAGRRE